MNFSPSPLPTEPCWHFHHLRFYPKSEKKLDELFSTTTEFRKTLFALALSVYKKTQIYVYIITVLPLSAELKRSEPFMLDGENDIQGRSLFLRGLVTSPGLYKLIHQGGGRSYQPPPQTPHLMQLLCYPSHRV